MEAEAEAEGEKNMQEKAQDKNIIKWARCTQ